MDSDCVYLHEVRYKRSPNKNERWRWTRTFPVDPNTLNSSFNSPSTRFRSTMKNLRCKPEMLNTSMPHWNKIPPLSHNSLNTIQDILGTLFLEHCPSFLGWSRRRIIRIASFMSCFFGGRWFGWDRGLGGRCDWIGRCRLRTRNRFLTLFLGGWQSVDEARICLDLGGGRGWSRGGIRVRRASGLPRLESAVPFALFEDHRSRCKDVW